MVRSTDPGDRRASLVALTAPGQGLLGEVDAARTRGAEGTLGHLTDLQREELGGLLGRVAPTGQEP